MTEPEPLRFHWRLNQGGDAVGLPRIIQNTLPVAGLPDFQSQIHFCRCAEENGIDSLLTDFGFSKPDPLVLAAALGLATERIKFIIAYRPGLLSPTTFVQQLNTLSVLIPGRFSLNIVAGSLEEEQRSYGDFLSHDERYERADEFLAICHAFWKGKGNVSFSGKYYRIEDGRLDTPFVSHGRTFPEIYIGGHSLPAQRLAVRQGTCWLRLADSPEKLRPTIRPILEEGREVGLRLAIISRPTRDEALSAARGLIEMLPDEQEVREREKRFVQRSESVLYKTTYELAETEWLTKCLWTGAVRCYGGPAIALVGSSDEVASAILEYKKIGVSQFILSGWPKLDEMIHFGKLVLPLVRKKEREMAANA